MHDRDNKINDCNVARSKKIKTKINKIYNIEREMGGVFKFKSNGKNRPKKRGAKSGREMHKKDEAVAMTGLVVDAEDLKVAVEEISVASKKFSLSPESSGNLQKAAQLNAEPLGKLPVVRASRSTLPSGGDSTEMSMMIVGSAPKLLGTQPEAVESTTRTRGGKNDNGRRKMISEEGASRYRNVENDKERIDRKF